MNTKTTIETLIETLAAKHGLYADELANFDHSVLRLCSAIDANPIDCTEERYDFYGLTVYVINGAEYAVGNDSECNDAWDASLESFIDECIIPQIEDENLRNYFDCEKWKRDARFDGRGHSLSSYDGEEIELGGDLYAYRIN